MTDTKKTTNTQAGMSDTKSSKTKTTKSRTSSEATKAKSSGEVAKSKKKVADKSIEKKCDCNGSCGDKCKCKLEAEQAQVEPAITSAQKHESADKLAESASQGILPDDAVASNDTVVIKKVTVAKVRKCRSSKSGNIKVSKSDTDVSADTDKSHIVAVAKFLQRLVLLISGSNATDKGISSDVITAVTEYAKYFAIRCGSSTENSANAIGITVPISLQRLPVIACRYLNRVLGGDAFIAREDKAFALNMIVPTLVHISNMLMQASEDLKTMCDRHEFTTNDLRTAELLFLTEIYDSNAFVRYSFFRQFISTHDVPCKKVFDVMTISLNEYDRTQLTMDYLVLQNADRCGAPVASSLWEHFTNLVSDCIFDAFEVLSPKSYLLMPELSVVTHFIINNGDISELRTQTSIAEIICSVKGTSKTQNTDADTAKSFKVCIDNKCHTFICSTSKQKAEAPYAIKVEALILRAFKPISQLIPFDVAEDLESRGIAGDYTLSE